MNKDYESGVNRSRRGLRSCNKTTMWYLLGAVSRIYKRTLLRWSWWPGHQQRSTQGVSF